MIGYFYSPQWFLSEVQLVRVTLPPYTDRLRRGAGEGGLRLPGVQAEQDHLEQVRQFRLPGRRRWSRTSTGPTTTRTWWPKYITADKMTPEAAAKKWVDANPAKVNAWLGK